MPATHPPEFGALVARCLLQDPQLRPSFAEVEAELARLRGARAPAGGP